MALHISIKSVSNNDNTFIASGSPKRALYSISLTPFLVAINPPYKIPLKPSPHLFLMAVEVAMLIFFASSISFFCKKGREWFISE